MEQEQWKPIEGYRGMYDVSNHGRVRSHYRGDLTIKKQRINEYGYCTVNLHGEKGKRICERVNRLVAIAFIPNPDNLSDVNHKDMNKLNNHVSNLEWTSHSDNVKHSYMNGRKAHRWTEEERKQIGMRQKAYQARRASIIQNQII